MTQSCEVSVRPTVVSELLSAVFICLEISGKSRGRCSANKARPPTLANTSRGVGNGDVDKSVSAGISSGSSASSVINHTILNINSNNRELNYLRLNYRFEKITFFPSGLFQKCSRPPPPPPPPPGKALFFQPRCL